MEHFLELPVCLIEVSLFTGLKINVYYNQIISQKKEKKNYPFHVQVYRPVTVMALAFCASRQPPPFRKILPTPLKIQGKLLNLHFFIT